jgi:hypothetical protein
MAFLALLSGCGRDTLTFVAGGRADLILSDVGLFGTQEIEICFDHLDPCTAIASFRGIRNGQDLEMEWRNDDTVELFLVAGRVIRCRPSIPGGFRIHLYRQSSASRRGSAKAGGAADVCGDFA